MSVKNTIRCLVPIFALLLSALPAWGQSSPRLPPKLPDLPKAEGVQLALVEAISRGDRAAFDAALRAGANPSSTDVAGYASWALCEAASLPGKPFDSYFLRGLLNAGADPNAYSPNRSVLNETALACALAEHHSEAVRLLSEKGADDSTTLCPDCFSPATPFVLALSGDNMWFALEIMERRTLSRLELEGMQRKLRLANLDGQTYNDRPLREHLENHLRENGLTPLVEKRKERQGDEKK